MKKEKSQNQNEVKNFKQGFTLLELLVVVVIIGILASIALPQYDKAVTKARLAEVLINVKAIEGSIERYLLKNGFPSEIVVGQDLLDIELSGGEWAEGGGEYYINGKTYHLSYNDYYELYVYNKEDANSSAIINVTWRTDEKFKTCYTSDTDKGRFICKYLEPLGWEYIDDYY